MDVLPRRTYRIDHTLWRVIMKELDTVRLIKDRARYREQGMNVGDIGTIMGGERNGYVLVIVEGEIFQDENGVYRTTEKDVAVRAEDLEVISEN